MDRNNQGAKTKALHFRGVLQTLMFFCLFLYLFRIVNTTLMGWPGDPNVMLHQIETPGTVDIAFMGSSHANRGIFPMELYQEYGFTAINQGQGGATIGQTYYLMREVIQWQKPKLIVLELYYSFFSSKVSSLGSAHRTINYLPWPAKAESVAALIPREHWAEFLMPITLYHNRWSELTQEDFSPAPVPSLTKGARIIFPKEFNGESAEYHSLDATEKKAPSTIVMEYLEHIINLCRETDTELLLLVVPYIAWGNERDMVADDMADDQRRFHWMRDYAAQQGVPFLNMLDYLDEMQFEMQNDMAEWSHMNYFGGKKATMFLGAYLQEHYGQLLQDRRDQAGFDSWESQVDAYNTYVNDEIHKRGLSMPSDDTEPL